MNDILDDLKEVENGFTIFVVEQECAGNRGKAYFASYRGKKNF